MMARRLEWLMARHGQSVCLTRQDGGGTAMVKAFLQPALAKREAPPITATPLGAASCQRWLYIGSGRQEIAPGDRAEWNGLRLAVQEARPVCWADETVYYWAILRREKEAAG